MSIFTPSNVSDVTLGGVVASIIIEDNPLQLEKAPLPIEINELGMEIEVNLLQP